MAEDSRAENTVKVTGAWSIATELVKVSPILLLCIVAAVALAVYHREISDLIPKTAKIGFGPVTWELAEQKIGELEKAFNPKLDKQEDLSKEQIKYLTKRFKEAVADAGYVNVLWVDDHPSNNLRVVDIFESMGFRVEIARSLTEATARFEERPFNLVISDLFQDRTADGTAEKVVVGPSIAKLVDEACGLRTIIYSAAWNRDSITPPHVFRETNSFYDLLDWSAVVIEEPLQQKCIDRRRDSNDPTQ